MIKDAFIILRKELKNIIKDKRTLIATLVIPFLLIPLMFIGMDFIENQQRETAEVTEYLVNIVNNDDPVLREIIGQRMVYQLVEGSGQGILTVEFSNGYQPGDHVMVKVFFDSTSSQSSYAASMLRGALSEYSSYLADVYLDDYGIDLKSLFTVSSELWDLAPEQAQGAGMLLMMVPYLILIYVFAGAMSVGMDTTAGEKERGSLAAILVNQVSRTSIALGKVMYAVVVGISSSIMTFLGFITAISITGGMFGEATTFSGFSFISLISLLLTLAVTSTLAASIIIFVGSLAKTMKEAASYIMPIYIIIVLLGVATMRVDPSSNQLLFLVPFLNTVFMIKGAIIGDVNLANLLLFLVSNCSVIAVFIISTSRLYNSERILNTVS